MDQAVACKRLLSAVVSLAVRDSCQTPGKKMLNQLPRDALDFLFNTSDGYLEWLDFDPEQFRKRLVNTMYAKKYFPIYGLSENDIRCMRKNYQMWCDENRL
jgi:hypothetical protein